MAQPLLNFLAVALAGFFKELLISAQTLHTQLLSEPGALLPGGLALVKAVILLLLG